jgi:hypothetical protein
MLINLLGPHELSLLSFSGGQCEHILEKYLLLENGVVFKLTIQHSPIIYNNNVLGCTLIDLHEQTKHIRGPRTNVTISPRP